MRTKTIDFVVFAFLLAILNSHNAACCAAEPPNVLLILADDVGQECLGCYGGESYQTPHLDRLADTGIQFQHCYSMPVCHPTRLALLTGNYPFRYGDVKWGSFPKQAETATFAHFLSNAGYATCVAGKWQMALLKDDPSHVSRLGFQQSDVFGWHEGPRYYEPMIYLNGTVREDTLGHYGPDLYVRSLVEFMRENRDRPFVAYFPMALCHDVTDDLKSPVPHGPFDRYDSYGEMIAEMDRSVGRLVAALDALELREKTLILFVGDNGTPRRMIARAEGDKLVRVPVVSRQNGKNVPGGKGTLMDTGTRVPLIANWPGAIKGKQTVDDLVDMSDFFPTLLELANINPETDVDGISFAKRLTKGEPSPRKWAYSESRRNAAFVRTADWKLYRDGRLVDMQNNANEINATMPDTDYSEATKQQRKKLQQALDSLTESEDPFARRRDFNVDGRKAFVIEPPQSKQPPGPMPWVWYAPTLNGRYPGEHEAWMLKRFHEAGIAMAGIDVGESYGSPNGRELYQSLYEELTDKRNYSKKPVLLARSRGGLMLYNWAVEHPNCVGAVAGIYPVCSITSYPGLEKAASAYQMTPAELKAGLTNQDPLERLASLAKSGVPIFHIHGDQDKIVPLEENSAALESRYKSFGGPIEVQVIQGQGHDLWSGWFQSEKLTNFVISHCR